STPLLFTSITSHPSFVLLTWYITSPCNGEPSARRTSTGARPAVRPFIRYGSTGCARSSRPSRRGTSVTITAPSPTALRVASGALPDQASGAAPSSATSATSNGTAGRDSPTAGAHSSAVSVLPVG